MDIIKLAHPVSALELKRMQRCYQATFDHESVSKAFQDLENHIPNVQVGHMLLMSEYLHQTSVVPIALWRKDFSCSMAI
ncbi:hypothetical protein ACPFUC_001915 [Vibrio cholerae]|jgi:hypothetical protein|uniref:hypothetical protein n=1 Tax=Vibrio fluvialis TaxID=676 RepID=UPI0025729D43|nr:hypothetical protein [Vibrio fluvialis]EGR4421489.1 hypothetical protein [Vibrio cholerae]BEI26606.1 hypothetical protein KKIDH5335_49380 [Vibrio fluvialis]